MIQLIAIREIGSCIWTGPAKTGQAVWVNTEEAARHLIEHGFCKLPTIEASAAKTEERALPKSVGEASPSHLTASPLSKERGPVRLSSASAAALLLPQRI